MRRRFRRALDRLTFGWATGTLPETARWLLDTFVIFLDKDKDLKAEDFDEEEWLNSCSAANTEETDEAKTAPAGPKKVRPIQMGEVLWKFVAMRLLKANKVDVDKVMTALRQYGCGVSGGAEAIQQMFQLVDDLWRKGLLPKPLARVKIDETNFFGRVFWDVIREESQAHLPRHAAPATWKHSGPSYVRQQGVPAKEKNRGAEQGDVDAPMEASLALGRVARKARAAIHKLQEQGSQKWCTEDPAAEQQCKANFAERNRRSECWRSIPTAERYTASGSKMTDPADEIQMGGGIVDFWYIDDEDALMDPRLVFHYLEAVDHENRLIGGERNIKKSEVIYYCSEAAMEEKKTEWSLNEVKEKAPIRWAGELPVITLGVACGDVASREQHFKQRIKAVEAMNLRSRSWKTRRWSCAWAGWP